VYLEFSFSAYFNSRITLRITWGTKEYLLNYFLIEGGRKICKNEYSMEKS
jgi:hypothetical protein